MKKIVLVLLSLTSFQAFSQFLRITPQTTTNPDFGSAIDISGNEVVSSTIATSSVQAKVYLFTVNGATYTQTDVITTEDGDFNDRFGDAVSIGNDFVAIGSPRHDSGFTNAGAVYIYRKIAGHYQFLQKLLASDADEEDFFGSYVKLSNNNLYISAINDEALGQPIDTNTGAVYQYAFDGNQWNFVQKITPPDSDFGNYLFGSKIETENNKVVIASSTSALGYGYANYHIYKAEAQTFILESSVEAAGTLESRVENFDYKDGKIYLLEHAIEQETNTKIEVLSYQDNIWTNEDVFFVPYIPNVWGDQIYTQIEVIGNRMFLGSSGGMLAESRKFPLLYFVKQAGEWTYQNVFYSEQQHTSHDDSFGSRLASSGNNLAVGAMNEIPGNSVYYLDSTTLGTKSFSPLSANIYPNPTSDKLFFQNAVMDAKIYSATGNLVHAVSGTLNELSLVNLSSGIYFIKVATDEGQSETFKIIKN